MRNVDSLDQSIFPGNEVVATVVPYGIYFKVIETLFK